MKVTAFYCKETGKLLWSLQGEHRYAFLIARGQARKAGCFRIASKLNEQSAKCVVTKESFKKSFAH